MGHGFSQSRSDHGWHFWQPIINDLQSFLTNLKPLKHFLVLEEVRSSKRISLCHDQYALEVLLGTGMLGCQPLDSLWIKSWSSKLDGELVKDTSSYRRLIGWLLYLTLTKLDITYVVNSQVESFPRQA